MTQARIGRLSAYKMAYCCRPRSFLKYSAIVLAVLVMYHTVLIFNAVIDGLDLLSIDHFIHGSKLRISSSRCFELYVSNSQTLRSLRKIATSWPSGSGSLNMDTWTKDDFCLERLDDIYWNPLFPDYPSEAKTLKNLDDGGYITESAVRRFLFFLRPKLTGYHILRVGLEGAMDLHVTEYDTTFPHSNQAKPKCFRTRVNASNRFGSYTSDSLYLDEDKYYLVDIIHMILSRGRMRLLWKTPNSEKFELIGKDAIFPYRPHVFLGTSSPRFPVKIKSTLRNKLLTDPRRVFHKRVQKRALDLIDIQVCDYHPSYLVNYTVEPDTGLWKIREGRGYPDFHIFYTNLTTLSHKSAQSIAREIGGMVTRANRKKQSYHKLHRIVFIEENKEEKVGHRYFVELDFKHKTSDAIVRLSDYFYKRDKQSQLCFPRNYEWKKNVPIYIIFTTSRNQRRWALITLDVIAKVIRITKDNYIHVIVVDFSTDNVNFTKELERRNLNFSLVSVPGRFNKVKGINKGAKVIQDPDSIIFTIDLHLEFPIFIFDEVRKNTIHNKTVYAPVLIRLPCGKHLEYTNADGAKWVTDGFGVLSMYKRDWDVIGGMNETRFGEKWGGEDWEVIDRVISKGYEVIQRRLPGYYHIFHSRKGSTWYEKIEDR